MGYLKDKAEWILGSLDTFSTAMSARKAVAFGLSMCTYYLVYAYSECLFAKQAWAQECFTSVLIILLIGIGFFLSLITVGQIIQLRTGNVSNTTTTENLNYTVKTEENGPDKV